VRAELEAWAQPHLALPLFVEKPGRTKAAAPRRWHGQRVMRQVEVESSDGRVAAEALRVVVGHASPLAQPQAQSSAAAQARATEAVAAHVRQVHARWFACRPEAEAAIAEDEGRGPGRRGRRPRPWRYHTVRSGIMPETRPTRRARRGRPVKTAPPPTESGSRAVVEVEGLRHPEEDHGWTVLATTGPPEEGTETEMLQAYHDHNTTVEPGFRWIKNPAAIAPVWRETPERMAALAMLTVVGWLVYRIIQRQVRLYLLTHDQQVPGNKGATATPTAAVVVSLFAHVALVQCQIADQEGEQVHGGQPHHLLCCDALGLDRSWDEAPSAQKSGRGIQTP
jgi:hypothetical protein